MKERILKLLQSNNYDDIVIGLNIIIYENIEFVKPHCKQMGGMWGLRHSCKSIAENEVYKLKNMYCFIGMAFCLFFNSPHYIPKYWKIIEL